MFMIHLTRKLGKTMSGSPWKQVCVAAALFVLAFGFVVIVTWATEPTLCINRIPARMLSPIPLREALEHTDGGNPWAISIAYIVGLVVFSGVLIATITNIIRTIGDRYNNGTAHYRFKNHILFLGYDELMIGTLKNVLGDKEDIVVAVPDNVTSVRNSVYQHLKKEETKRVVVVKASRTNVDDLKRRVFVGKALRIFVIGQPDEPTHDAANLKSLGLIAALCSSGNKSVRPGCMYYLRNQSTFYLVHRLNFKDDYFNDVKDGSEKRIDKSIFDDFIKASEPFNFHESIARHILFDSGDHLQLYAGDGNPHLIIYGMTSMGIALMRDVLMTQHFPKRRLHVTMVDENAREEMHYIIGRHRPFFENCHYSFHNYNDPLQDYEHPAVWDYLGVDMEFIQCDVAHPDLSKYLRECVAKEKSSVAIAICTDDSPKNMALAIYMPQQVLENNVPIWVYQHGDNSMNAFVEKDVGIQSNMGKRYKNIHVFSTLNYGITRRDKTSNQWRLAMAASKGYAERHPEYYKDREYQWETEQPKSRWSSLYGAISKLSMLNSLNLTSYPLTLSNQQSDQIAKAEHDRWNTEKLLNGWYPAEWGISNEFEHQYIRSFEDLENDPQKRNIKQEDYDQLFDVVNELNKMYNE